MNGPRTMDTRTSNPGPDDPIVKELVWSRRTGGRSEGGSGHQATSPSRTGPC